MDKRRENARDDARSRRRTLRQSILQERRGTAQLSNESTPEPAPKLTRAAAAKQAAKDATTKKLEEWRRRKALAVKEMQKARPPFNPYVRVKHTGFSPYTSKNSKTMRSQAIPAKPAPSTRSTRAVAPNRTLRIPTLQVNAGTSTSQHQPVPFTFNGQSSFKPPSKIQPLPLTNRPTRSTKDPPVKDALPKPKVTQGAKGMPKAVPINGKPLEGPRRAPQPQTSEVSMPKPALPPHKVLLQSRRTTTLKKVSPRRAQKVSRVVEPSTRVLRSSVRLVNVGKENVPPQEGKKEEEKLTPREKVVAEGPKMMAKRNLSKQQVDEAGSSTVPASDTRSIELQARRDKLQSETDRLRELADDWLVVKDNVALPGDIVDEIDAVTGQTNLLITKKFRQYEGLINGAVTDPRTTLEDLDGFWDMIFIQVDQLDGKFQALQKLKQQNWNSKSPVPFKHVQIRERKPSKRVGKSNFLKTLAQKKMASEFPPETSVPESPVRDRTSVLGERLPTPASPLLDMSVGEPSFNSSFQSLDNSKSTPRALNNQRRASRSQRFSHAVMRLSSLVDTSLNISISDE